MDAYSQCSGVRKFAVTFAALGISALVARADLFVSDTFNNVVDHYDSGAAFVNSYSVTGPTGVALGPDGNLYVATPYDDGLGNGASVVTFNPTTGTQLGTFTSHVSDNSLNNPAAIAFDSSGNLYVGDLQSKILVYNSSGGTHTAALTDANLNAPNGLAFGPAGVLYAADEGSGDVLKYAAGAFSVVNTAGAHLNAPADVAVGADGTLYVLDISGASEGVYSLNPTTGFATEIINYSTSPFDPNNLAIGPGGNLFVSGEDSDTGDGDILDYSTNGVGGEIYLDLGHNAVPTFMDFTSVPEPSALALAAVSGVALASLRIRRKGYSAK